MTKPTSRQEPRTEAGRAYLTFLQDIENGIQGPEPDDDPAHAIVAIEREATERALNGRTLLKAEAVKALEAQAIAAYLQSPEAERALAEAIESALQVRKAAMAMNAEHGFAIFEDDDYRATAASVLAVLRSNSEAG